MFNFDSLSPYLLTVDESYTYKSLRHIWCQIYC